MTPPILPHLPITIFFACLIALTLPFMQLFTVNVGFALKIYEIAILLWLPCSLMEGMPVFRKKTFFIGLLFVAYTVLALWINLDLLQKKESYAMLARFTPFLDGLLKSAYILLCIIGTSIVGLAAARDPKRVADCWLVGAGLCALVQLALFTLSFTGHTLPAIPGMPDIPQYMSIFGHPIYRAATFLEANTGGPYLAISMLIALHYSRRLLAALLFAALITTFSSSAFCGLIVAAGYMFMVSKKTNFGFLLSALTIIVTVVIIFPVIDFIIFDKLADIRADSSLGDRLFKGMAGLEMFFKNPLLGVGLSQFGLCFYDYISWVQDTALDIGHDMTDRKVIANVVYIEVLAETGILGAALFCLLVADAAAQSMRNHAALIRAGIIAIFVFWLACPSFTIMYFWAFFGLAAGIARHQACHA